MKMEEDRREDCEVECILYGMYDFQSGGQDTQICGLRQKSTVYAGSNEADGRK